MAKDETPPFERGCTFSNGNPIDLANLGGTNFEGKEYRFEDNKYGTGMYVGVRVLRNSATFNLLPGRVGAVDTTQVATFAKCNGYTTVASQAGFIIDEFLPPAGVPPGDLFYGIVDGPVKVAGSTVPAEVTIAVGDPIGAAAGSTAGGTISGRVSTLGGATSAAAIYNLLGRAMAALTAGQTGAPVLIHAHRWLG